MNIFTRVWRIIQAHIHGFLNKADNPQLTLERSLRDMQKQVERVRGDVIRVIADEKKLKNQVEKYQQEVERWEKNAVLALKKGDDTLAREALRRKRDAIEFSQQLRPQWEEQQVLASRLKNDYGDLRERIRVAQRKKRLLMARLRRAETQKRLQGMLDNLSSDRVFERLESKILETESMNAAQEELREESLEEKFAALEQGQSLDVEQELEAMREQLRLNS